VHGQAGSIDRIRRRLRRGAEEERVLLLLLCVMRSLRILRGGRSGVRRNKRARQERLVGEQGKRERNFAWGINRGVSLGIR
jgi:hypothetical protein